jgi:hypothetical protein
VANGSATAVVGATHGNEVVASGRDRPGRDATDLVRECTPRAEQVASRYVRLPLRLGRDCLCRLAKPTLDVIQDVLRRPTTRPERAAERCDRHHGITDDGSVSPDVSGK